MIRKNIFYIPFLFISAMMLSSCHQDQKKDDSDKFQDKLHTFNSSINKVDNAIKLMDSLEQELNKVKAERDAGKITEAEAQKLMDAINKTLGRKVARSTNYHPASSLPNWAIRLGLSTPVNMTIDSDYSQTTSESNPDEGFNSLLMVYKGNYENAMKQAAIIAARARVPMTPEYKTIREMNAGAKNEDIIKGVAYMNFEPGAPNQPKYAIAITVSEKGVLTISATDSKQMEIQLQKGLKKDQPK
ncbi:MAG: hypothetical protein JXR71_05325 [Bacteroidales bacterium]|nr:hypothetical protein [Bacteroidales bacterium]